MSSDAKKKVTLHLAKPTVRGLAALYEKISGGDKLSHEAEAKIRKALAKKA